MNLKNSRSCHEITCVSILVLCAIAASPQAAEISSAHYQGLAGDQFMKKWLLLSPIAISTNQLPNDAQQKKAFASEVLEIGSLQPKVGQIARINGTGYRWRPIESRDDVIDLNPKGETNDFSIAYAWAEIEMAQPAKTEFGLGSDDSVKVWLNGKLIHEHWGNRIARKDDDVIELHLQAGQNQLLLKVQNFQGHWGFVCRPLTAAGLEEKLVLSAARGDLDEVKKLLDRGVDVKGTDKRGLTAWQAARIHGHEEVGEFLRSQGADAGKSMPKLEQVLDATFQEIVRDHSPGASVLVAQGGKILFEKGYGLANLEHRVPITPQTKFRIGSISKQFTASAILKLCEQGTLRLDNKLSKFIPDFPRGDEVTIHHLLTHTSGIHSYTSKPDFMATVMMSVKTEDLINSFKNDPSDFAPGTKWSYNNSGYLLLGYIIEKVSGQTYEGFLGQNFFEPLAMNNTGVHHAIDVLEHEAHGYAYDDGKMKKALNWDMSRAGGAGALYSTVGDLFRWNEAVFHGKVLREESLATAFTPVKTAENETERPAEGYGYGWAISKLRGLKVISHGGGLNGFSSFLLRVPQEEFTVALLANAAPAPPGLDPDGLANEIAQFCLADKLEARPTLVANKNVSSKTYDAFVGRYDYGVGIMTVMREGDRLFAQMAGQGKYEILPRSETEFFWKVVDAQVTFLKNEKGAVIKAVHHQSGQTISASRLPDEIAIKLGTAALEACVGKYDYGNGEAILTVTREGDSLFAQVTGQPRLEIFAKSETEFFWKTISAQVAFVKNEKGKVIKAIHQQGGRKFDAPRLD